MEIYKALAEVNKGTKAIAKDRRNEQQGFKYRGIDEVMNELHSLFAANEIIILQTVNSVEVTERTNQRGTVLFYVRINVTYHFTHSNGSHADITVFGEAMDSGDKATTKAMSIALKYALLQMFLIPTEEDKDPDAQTHEVKAKAATNGKAQTEAITPPPMDQPVDYKLIAQKILEIDSAGSVAELEDIYRNNKPMQKEREFIVALAKKKAQLKTAAK
jgi:hypothetical protein